MQNYTETLYNRLPVQVERICYVEEEHCNISNIELLNLCGGITDDSIAGLNLTVNIHEPCIYEVEVACDTHYAQRTINFKTKIISNELLKVAIPNKGVGTMLFVNQIIAAKQAGFNEVNVMATKGEEYNGFIHWGKLGYTLSAYDRLKFDAFCKQHNIVCTSLWDYLCNTGGEEFWKQNGFGWSGTFNLSANSININQLRIYLQKRGFTLPHF